ncbi:MAG TPA: hypothetical protein VGJ15_10785 [Pirellulales bacterium]|jgi:hypothetical protein
MSEDNENNKPDFNEYADRLRSSYQDVVDLRSERYHDLIPDLYEAWEDLEIIHPLLTSIVSKQLTSDEFRDALITIEVRVRHTVGHFNGILDALKKLDEEQSDQEQ